MNPYTILAIVMLAIGLFFGGEHVGHSRGVDQQKVADQLQFDAINKKLTDQKAEANAQYRKDQDANLALVVERDQLKTTLEKEHETNRIATNALRNKYAIAGLRFSAIQSSGLGDSSRVSKATNFNSASSSGTTIIQLPDSVAADLRQLAFDADTLADSYRECYGYARQVK